MSLRWKNIAYSVILLSAVLIVWKYRQNKASTPVKLEGATMGTSYHITYFDASHRNFQAQIDSVLKVFNQSLSTYIGNSEVSLFNDGSGFKFRLPFFRVVLTKSREVVSGSNGAFDPTVMPLVNVWGFGPKKDFEPDSTDIDSIREFIGFEKITFTADSAWKSDPRVQLDFSAIAKGYGVDVVADLLSKRGIKNFFVEIGGEVTTKGTNLQTENAWQVGILDPTSTYENQWFMAYVSLSDQSLATSGNYFNYREVNGKKFSHTIDPISGYPIQREILSASVFANDCMTADAWATAFMVMGHQKAIETLKSHPELDAVLVFTTKNGIDSFVSDGVRSKVKFKQ